MNYTELFDSKLVWGANRCLSKKLPEVDEYNNDNIFLVMQFFMPKDSERLKEIQHCLRESVTNRHISKIYLINERMYSDDELGITQKVCQESGYKFKNINKDKIEQIIIERRITFKDVFDHIDTAKLDGYVIFANSDIFFDDSIKRLKTSGIENEKAMIAQLRYEYKKDTKLEKCPLFGPRWDSQDAWIIHSKQNVPSNLRKCFAFFFGQPGCDNKLLYLFKILNYEIYNDPSAFKIYHYHTNETRNYDLAPIPPLYYYVSPYGVQLHDHTILNPESQIVSMMSKSLTRFNFHDDHKTFMDYLTKKIDANENFIVPRIAGIENNYAVISENIEDSTEKKKEELKENNNGELKEEDKDIISVNPNDLEYIKKTIGVMKTNPGIKLSNINSVMEYGKLYMDSFKNCDLFLDWEQYGKVYKYISKSHDYVFSKCKKDKKTPVWSGVMDIFHFIQGTPWTHALRGKKILLISPFVESFKEKLEIRKEIYGIDLFPECEFVTLMPPQTQGSEKSQLFTVELEKFQRSIDEILEKDGFDVALCSCGGYGNLICDYIYSLGKSAIYVGGVLQMYFGVYGERWIRERPDILKLYQNRHWTRPKEEERPKDYKKVEDSCYW